MSRCIWGFPKNDGFSQLAHGFFPTRNDHFGMFWGYHHFGNTHIFPKLNFNGGIFPKCHVSFSGKVTVWFEVGLYWLEVPPHTGC